MIFKYLDRKLLIVTKNQKEKIILLCKEMCNHSLFKEEEFILVEISFIKYVQYIKKSFKFFQF